MTNEEIEKRIVAIEKVIADFAKKILGDRITEAKVGMLWKRVPGERVKTGGYIEKVEHKTGQKGPWQAFKLANGEGKGVFAKHFGQWPEWASEGVACTVDEMTVELWNGKNTYTVRKWGPYAKPHTQNDVPIYRPAPEPENEYVP